MLKTGTFILGIAMVFCLVYSLLLVFNPELIAESTLEARTGETFASVQETDVADVIIVQSRHLGVFAFTTTIALIFILFVGFRKGEKWAWWAFLVTGIIVWGYGLIVQLSEGDVMNTILHLIGAGLLLLGLLIPIKEFFVKGESK
jgi:uncharacterized membrane protein